MSCRVGIGVIVSNATLNGHVTAVSCRVGVGVMVSNATLNGIQRNCYLQKLLNYLALKSFDLECT